MPSVVVSNATGMPRIGARSRSARKSIRIVREQGVDPEGVQEVAHLIAYARIRGFRLFAGPSKRPMRTPSPFVWTWTDGARRSTKGTGADALNAFKW